MDVLTAITTGVAFITVFCFVVGGGYMIYAWNVQPIKARSPFLMAGMWTGAMGMCITTWIQTVYPDHSVLPCIVEVWTGGVFMPLWCGSLVLRAFQLIVIFNLAKRTLSKLDREGDSAAPDKDGSSYIQKKLHANTQWVTEKRLVIILLATIGFFLIFPPITTYYSLTTYGNLTDTRICESNVTMASAYVFFFALIVSYVTLGIQLRKVHDAFWLKKEFKYLGIAVIPPGIASMTIIAIGASVAWRQLASMVIYMDYGIFCFMMPSAVAFLNRPPTPLRRWLPARSTGVSGSTNASRDSNREREGDSSGTSQHSTASRTPHQLLEEFLSDKVGLQIIEEFMVHYQLLRMSRYLLLYFDIKKFQTTTESTALISKACILFQKYLKADAYLAVDCLTDEQRAKFQKIIDDAVAGEEEDEESKKPKEQLITSILFDDLLDTLEQQLEKHLFKPFLKSKYYHRYTERQSLKKGLEPIAPNSKTDV